MKAAEADESENPRESSDVFVLGNEKNSTMKEDETTESITEDEVTTTTLPSEEETTLVPLESTDHLDEVNNHPNIHLINHRKCGAVSTPKIIRGDEPFLEEYGWL